MSTTGLTAETTVIPGFLVFLLSAQVENCRTWTLSGSLNASRHRVKYILLIRLVDTLDVEQCLDHLHCLVR